MRRLMAVVEYVGTRYHGFQRQSGLPTIQDELEQALSALEGTPVSITYAARTDAGVHARGQVICFDLARRTIPAERIPYALNHRLPSDIVVVRCREVPPIFHPRYDAKGKLYSYTLYHRRIPSPFWRDYAWLVPRQLNWDAVQMAACHFLGRHDFRAFRATGSSAKTTVRHIRRLEVIPGKDLSRFLIEADGFLYHMARLMVGALVWVGVGKLGPDIIADALRRPYPHPIAPKAPAHGLCLEEVLY